MNVAGTAAAVFSIALAFVGNNGALAGIGGACLVINIAGLVNDIKEIRRGSNRKAEEGAQDPAPYTFTINGQPLTTSNLTLPASSFLSLNQARAALTKRSEPDLEVVEDDTPILAHRVALIQFRGSSKPFAALSHGDFGVDEHATCKSNPFSFYGESTNHPAPALGCTCGFYAVPPDIPAWTEGGEYVTLLVELSGTVIEHEKGYRAEHQRVVECQIPPCCYCGSVATHLDVREQVMQRAVCDSHVGQAEGDRVLVAVDDVRQIVGVPVTTLGRVNTP